MTVTGGDRYSYSSIRGRTGMMMHGVPVTGDAAAPETVTRRDCPALAYVTVTRTRAAAASESDSA